MKENEEITNLERFELLIEDCKGHRELYGEFSVGEYDIEIIQHILSDYKRVLKENEQLRTEVNSSKKEYEKYKRLAEMNLKSAEEFKNNMCEHRCLLKSENEILQKENKELKEYLTTQNCEILKILLNLIEKLQKENKELKESNEILNDAYWNECITKQTIKDKIEEILNNNEYRIVFEGDAEFPDEATTIKAQEYIKLDVLQELLEGRK